MLTYLVASFVGFLHQHPPLVVQLHGHAAAAVRVFAHPAEELLQLPPQGGVGVGAGLGVAGARQESLWGGHIWSGPCVCTDLEALTAHGRGSPLPH